MQEDFLVNLIFLASKGKDECHRFLRTPGKNKMSCSQGFDTLNSFMTEAVII